MRSFTSATVVAFAVASIAAAHGPQIQITSEGGKIVTREVFLDGPYDSVLADPKSVYVIPLLPSGTLPNQQWFSRPNIEESAPGVPAFNSGPGIAYGIGSTFSSGFSFRLNFIDGLKFWNGTGFVDPGSEEIQAFRGSSTTPSASATTSDSGPFGGIDFPAIASGYSGDAHNSASFRLLGDGASPTSGGDDGVYLLSLQLASTDPGLATSDPYYFVLHKNESLSTALVAARSLGFSADRVQVVPEASSFVMSGLAMGGLTMALATMKRRQQA